MYYLNDINSTSLFDYSYTYQYSKYSCSTTFYYIHVSFSYLVFISGIFSFISRLHEKLHPIHEWSGRIYILSMLYATATSLLINNTGLPLGVLVSFCLCIGGLTIGWFLILKHKKDMNDKVINRDVKEIFADLDAGSNFLNNEEKFNEFRPLKETILRLKGKDIEKKTFIQRLFSYKSFHGIFMFMSWINIAGRVFVTPLSDDFTCYTYPIYKQPNMTNSSTIEFEIVPEDDPNYDRLPWANMEDLWGVYLSLGPIIFGIIIGLIWIFVSERIKKICEN